MLVREIKLLFRESNKFKKTQSTQRKNTDFKEIFQDSRCLLIALCGYLNRGG